jgi:hypothetical protein
VFFICSDAVVPEEKAECSVPSKPFRLVPHAAGQRRAAVRREGGKKGIFLIWMLRNPLKSPESDEEIQGNPSPFSWSGLDWL